MKSKYLRKEKQLREVWVYFFICPLCHNEYSHTTSLPLKFCSNCRSLRSKKIVSEPSFKQVHNRDLTVLIDFVVSNQDKIDYISVMREISLNPQYYSIPDILSFDDFKNALDVMPSHWVYAFFARFIPNTSFKFIDNLLGTKSSASRLYNQCYKLLRHPRVKRDVFASFRKDQK